MHSDTSGVSKGKNMIRYMCRKCGVELESPSELAGKNDRCPACGEANAVPSVRSGPVGEIGRLAGAKRRESRGRVQPAAPKPGRNRTGAWVKGAAVASIFTCLGILAYHVYFTANKTPETPRTDIAAPIPTTKNSGNTTAPSATTGDIFDRVAATMTMEEFTSKPPAKALSPEDLFAKCSPAVVRVVVFDAKQKPIGLGSGFFVSDNGLLATNHHVIKGGASAVVLLPNKARLTVEGVAAIDQEGDLCLLKVDGENLPFLALAGEPPPKVGAKVYAIGNPEGMTNTLSEGLISGLRKITEGKTGLTVIQTTAAISHGSSGGPLLTSDGKVVGVTTAYLPLGQNLNLASPANRITALITQAREARTLISMGGDGARKVNGPKPSALHDAARAGDVRQIQALLDQGVYVDTKDEYGRTPLMCAASDGKVAAVKLLLSKGAAVNYRTPDGFTIIGTVVLIWTCTPGTLIPGMKDVVEVLLANGADVNAPGTGGTPLHTACSNGDASMVELLVRAGADVNAKHNGFGATPLHMARDVKIVELLLAKGAKVNATDKEGLTPLHWQASTSARHVDGASEGCREKLQDECLKIVEVLLANGAKVNATDKNGKTPLWNAKEAGVLAKESGGNKKMIALLLKHGGK